MKFNWILPKDTRSTWTESVFPKQIEVRVLIVADGSINFKDELDGFGLTELCAALHQSALPWEKLIIATAHRSSDQMGADIPCFKFDSVSPSGDLLFSITHYEQLWLFGYEREQSEFCLKDKELKVISDFMNDGGGVFATGDHEDLGFALCGKLPRVRSMRRWHFDRASATSAPPRDGRTRIDTLRAGKTPGFQKGDEADGVPQEICPKFFLDEDGLAAHPHPLLANGDLAITILPDHMHEGECVLPERLDGTYQFDGDAAKQEYPPMLRIPAQVSPVVVAIATSGGGYVVLERDILPVEPSCFKIITAYDGHYVKQFREGKEVKLGRVVVDASFHHFVNLNLKGFYDNGHATSELEVIKKYYRNILRWLVPANLQPHYYLNLLLALRYSPGLIEEFSSNPEFGWDEILYAGGLSLNAIAANFSITEAKTCAIAVASLLPDGIRAFAKEFLDPWFPILRSSRRPRVFIDSRVVLKVILGSTILGIASKLPENPYEVREALAERQLEGEDLPRIAAQGVTRGVTIFAKVLNESNITLRQVSAALSAFG